MGGASLFEAKAALRLCLRHLRAGDRFDVVEFNSVSRAFAGRPVAFDPGALARADDFVGGLRATGGTEMMRPLVEAVRAVPGGIVVLLTDGQVGDEEEVLEAALAAGRGTRVHCIGIGTSVSDALLRDLARRTGGAVEFIHPGERVDEKVLALFARALAPRVEDPRVAFEGVDVAELAPDGEYPPIVDGEPWTLLGRYAAPGEGRATIRGTLRGRPFALEIPLALPEAAERPILPRIWATERIRALSEARVEGRRAAAMRERIVRLAVEHGVSCPHTAFVVVETREGERRARGQPEVRVVPVSVPAGWDMFANHAPEEAVRRRGVSRFSRARPGAPPPPAAPFPGMASPARVMEAFDTEACIDALEMSAPPSPAASFERAARGPVGGSAGGPSGLRDPALAVLSGLGADGLWGGEGDDGSPEARALRASARALLRLRDLGLDTAHPLHGALLRKAVEAVVRLARRAHDREPRLAEAALAAAWGVATGARTRGTVEAAIRALPGTDLAGRLGDAPAVRARAEECLGGVG
ncbi:hypothetical protein L6R50_20770 [Myxococcota bacterium]|nr:hypothetical protein [Myxococcota bacterium]